MREIKNIYLWLLITAVLLLSVQIISIVIYIYSFIPYPVIWSDPFFKGVEPNRDALFYEIFVMTNIVLMALSVKWILPKMDSLAMRRKLRLWLGLEGIWCFLMVFCFFKWTTYRYPFWNVLPYENSTWLQPFFCVTSVLALLSKIFFPEIENFFRQLKFYVGSKTFFNRYTIALQVIFILGIVLLLYIPHPQDVVALALMWDQWNHLDRVAGWLIRHGWYVNYEETIRILVILSIGYVVGLFYFIRLWLNSWLLSAIGAVLAIKMGMFFYATAPCVWVNPGNTFLAHGWDIALFFGIWFVSVKYPQRLYAACAVIAAVLALGWFKSNGYLETLGMDNQPLMAPLRVRQFFPYFMGYFVPLFYIFSLLIFMGIKNSRNALSLRLPVIFCIYGLVTFIDYLEHPMIGFYGTLIVPAILILLWGIDQLLSSSTLFVRRMVYAGILLLAIGALLTNRLMLVYPNSLFQDNGRFASERASYEHFEIIGQSASLIERLTQEAQKVVVLSNFETALLMQAHRKPLFKDFPVMFSSLNDTPGQLNLRTKKQGLGLIDSLADENALYVFVDQRLLALPEQSLGSGLNAVLSYLRNHYQEYTRQGFLVALQRK